MREVVGIICPKCGLFTTEKHTHPQDTPTFWCKTCQKIIEIPIMMRRNATLS